MTMKKRKVQFQSRKELHRQWTQMMTELSPLNERRRHWNRRWVYHRRLAKTTTQATGQRHHSSVRRGRPTATRQTALCQTPCRSAMRTGCWPNHNAEELNNSRHKTSHRSSPKPKLPLPVTVERTTFFNSRDQPSP
jgi:hypothetical protein